MPGKVNAFASLSVTYLTCFVLSVIMFYATSSQKNLLTEISKVNWTSFVLGPFCRSPWNSVISALLGGMEASAGSLVANISLACVLLFVGLLLYKETISLRQVVEWRVRGRAAVD